MASDTLSCIQLVSHPQDSSQNGSISSWRGTGVVKASPAKRCWTSSSVRSPMRKVRRRAPGIDFTTTGAGRRQSRERLIRTGTLKQRPTCLPNFGEDGKATRLRFRQGIYQERVFPEGLGNIEQFRDFLREAHCNTHAAMSDVRHRPLNHIASQWSSNLKIEVSNDSKHSWDVGQKVAHVNRRCDGVISELDTFPHRCSRCLPKNLQAMCSFALSRDEPGV